LRVEQAQAQLKPAPISGVKREPVAPKSVAPPIPAASAAPVAEVGGATQAGGIQVAEPDEEGEVN
jgi:hypothetical protein